MGWKETSRCQGTRLDGQPCGQPAVIGRQHCRRHGGKTLTDIASPSYGRHSDSQPGTYSKWVPSRLADEYRKAQRDPQRLSLLHEIALWVARADELTKRLDPHDPGASWLNVRGAWDKLTTAKAALDLAQHTRDITGMRTAYQQFQTALDQGQRAMDVATKDYGLWREIKDAHDMLLKLKSQEHKRNLELQHYWNSEQVAARWTQFLHALWEAAMLTIPKEAVRPFLREFQDKMRAIHYEMQLTARDVTPAPTPAAPPDTVLPETPPAVPDTDDTTPQ